MNLRVRKLGRDLKLQKCQMIILAKLLIYFKSNRHIKNWSWMISKGTEDENYSYGSETGLGAIHAWSPFSITAWWWRVWEVRTLRHNDLESLPKVTELLGGRARKGNCLQHLCSLQKRTEDDSLTEEVLEDHFYQRWFSNVSLEALGLAGDWWKRDPGRRLALSSYN